MKITYDENKSRRNFVLRQLPFSKVEEFEWESAIIFEDKRYNYPEPRFTASEFIINERLYVLVYTPTLNGIRVISFRKANKREIKKYEQERITTFNG